MLAFDVIKEVGLQGEFLSNMHTFQNFRKTFYHPTLTNRQNTAQWESDGSLSIEKAANLKWKNLLSNYQEPALDPVLDAELRTYIKK